MILLDTDVCIEILRGNELVIQKRKMENDNVAVSFITAGELFYGAYKSQKAEYNLLLVNKFLLTLKIIQSNYEMMRIFGELKAELSVQNRILPDANIMIAATCFSHCEKLITGNGENFKRFKKLKIENWIR